VDRLSDSVVDLEWCFPDPDPAKSFVSDPGSGSTTLLSAYISILLLIWSSPLYLTIHHGEGADQRKFVYFMEQTEEVTAKDEKMEDETEVEKWTTKTLYGKF
jgi:hypothetical protein